MKVNNDNYFSQPVASSACLTGVSRLPIDARWPNVTTSNLIKLTVLY